MRLFFRISGWRALDSVPNIPKFVLILSPHTSYTDNWLLAAVQAHYHFEGYWLAAEKLFDNPILGRLIYWAGARKVERAESHNLVDQYVDQFNTHDHMILGLAPSGTRKHRPHWKSGFYWIAYHADVPIVCLTMDYATKTLQIGPTVYPSGDIYADMATIQAFYDGKMGRRPNRMTPVQVAEDIDVSIYQHRKAS
jgi:1-acyl-sn-glycerol-3-phosphate acyltransferase